MEEYLVANIIYLLWKNYLKIWLKYSVVTSKIRKGVGPSWAWCYEQEKREDDVCLNGLVIGGRMYQHCNIHKTSSKFIKSIIFP